MLHVQDGVTLVSTGLNMHHQDSLSPVLKSQLLMMPSAHGERKQNSWIWGVFQLPPQKRQQPDRKGKAKEVDAATTAQSLEPAAPTWEEQGG